MNRLFSVHETAEGEVNEATDFYDLEGLGLGSLFLDEIEHAIEAISQFPDAAQLVR